MIKFQLQSERYADVLWYQRALPWQLLPVFEMCPHMKVVIMILSFQGW